MRNITIAGHSYIILQVLPVHTNSSFIIVSPSSWNEVRSPIFVHDMVHTAQCFPDKLLIFTRRRHHNYLAVEGTSAIWWRNLFSEERLSPRFSAFGQWAIQIRILEVSITSSKIFKELCLINYLTWRPVYCYFEKRMTLNLQKKADCLKIFIRTNYVHIRARC